MQQNFIQNIEIKNFKSIRHQKIEGCKRINVFIGYPNVGKSNILEAIGCFSLLKESVQMDSFADLIRLESLNDLFFEGEVGRQIEIIVNGKTIVLSKDRYHLGLELEHISCFSVNEQFRISSKSIVESEVSSPFSTSEYTTIINGLPSIKKYHFRSKNTFIQDYSGELRFPYGENLMEILNNDKVLRKEVGELFGKYGFKLILDKSSNTIRMGKLYNDDDGTIFMVPYSLIADTLQRLIFYKAAIYSNNNTVLLLEEPEAHMFPPYISTFASDIWDKEENQYFIATHSPFVLNSFLENAKNDLAIYLLDFKNGETVVKRMTDEEIHEVYQYGMDLFFNIESFLK